MISVRQLVSQPVVDKWSLLSLISSLSLSSLSVLKGTLQKCARRERSWSVVGQGDSKRDIDSMYVLKCININSRRYSFYEFQVSWSKFQEVNTYCKVLKAIRYFYSSVDTCVGYHLVKYELFIRIAHVCPGAIVYFSDMFRYQP